MQSCCPLRTLPDLYCIIITISFNSIFNLNKPTFYYNAYIKIIKINSKINNTFTKTYCKLYTIFANNIKLEIQVIPKRKASKEFVKLVNEAPLEI